MKQCWRGGDEERLQVELELDDVEKAFRDMTFIGGLKPSKRQVYMGYGEVLLRQATSAVKLLTKANSGFASIGPREMMNVCLDDSVVARKEFNLSCRSNKPLGMVGNAHLASHLAVKCYLNRSTPQQYQELRNTLTSQANKAAVFDVLFHKAENGDVTFRWGFEDTPQASVRQKADFIDALIGLLFLSSKWDLSDWLCVRVVEAEGTK